MMLSVIIIAKNAAETIERCLQSVAFADEIVVLDSGSTDETSAIAKRYTEQVFVTDWPGYGKQKQRALDKATATWVLNLDADEWVSDELREDILLAMRLDEADAYRVPIFLQFYDKVLRYSLSPKKHIRFYKRAGVRYTDNIVHESVVLPKSYKIAQFKSGLLHISYRDLTQALQKLNQYSSASAVMRQHKKRPSFIKTVFSAMWMFFRCYVIQAGFLEGRDGFVLAVFSAENSFYRGMKMIYQDKDFENV